MSRTLRILSLANCPPDDRLGSGYVIRRSAEGLSSAGHEVDLYGPADYVPFYGVAPGRAVTYRQATGMAAKAAWLLARKRYDVVEVWGGDGWLAMDLLTHWPGERPLLVCRSNGLEPHCEEVMRASEAAGTLSPSRRWYHLSQSSLFTRALRRADALVTVSSWDLDWALARGLSFSGRAIAIENPLPDSYLGIEPNFERGPVLGYCGTWIQRKGTGLLVQALPDVLREFPEWRLLIVGPGPGFRADECFPADVLPRIEVVPHADREADLKDLYGKVAISILPSVYESFGLVATEAMACGAALVASRVGFAAGLRHGEEGWLLSERSPAALREALCALIRDSRQRQALARGGYRRVQSLRWDQAIATLEAAYAEWLSLGRRTVA